MAQYIEYLISIVANDRLVLQHQASLATVLCTYLCVSAFYG